MEPLDDRLTELPLRELLERLAAGTPAPGGGSAAAITCAVAAALAEMASALSHAPTAASDSEADADRSVCDSPFGLSGGF